MSYSRFTILFLSFFFLISIISCQKEHNLLDDEERIWLDEHPDLVAAFNPTYAPYQFINEQGNLDGIFVDFIHLIEERIEYTFKKKKYLNWNDILIDAKKGEIDVIFEIQETNDRRDYLTFSSPLISQPHVIVTSQNVKPQKRLSFFNNKKVGVIKSYAIDEYLSKNHPDFELVHVSNDEEAYQRLANKELDAIVSFQAIANYFINQRGYNTFIINKEIPYLNQSTIANLREHYVLSNIFDKAIRDMSTKEKKAIFNSWSPTLVKPMYQENWFWLWILGILLGFLILNTIVNNLLKAKVKEKTIELQLAKEKAEESSRLKTTFLHNISHEIRTPLNAVVGFSEMLERGVIAKEEHPKFLKVIKHSGEQLISVIDDILEISSLDSKKAKVHNSEVNVSEILQELCAIYEVKTLQKNVRLLLNGPQDLRGITDGPKLRKILSGLIDNAVKNTDKGSIEIHFEYTNESIEFIISDTGKGISADLLSNIFERFQKSSNEIKDYDEGIGLGLAITKENIELLKGSIDVSSTIDEGSRFSVAIPFILIEDSCSNNAVNIDTSSLNIKSVLIAEDGKINFIVLKRLLLKLLGDDIEILHAENGQIAVDLAIENKQIDLILMDIKMPVMDGYEATQKIIDHRKDVPIIAQTAYAAPDDQQKTLDAGCVDVITKPIKIEALKAILVKNISK